MTHPIVVGITGRKGHGKDTAAAVLVEHGYTKVAFADHLKETMAFALGVPVHTFHDPATKENVHPESGKPYREWLQKAGTEFFRSMWPDIWITMLRRKVLMNGYTHVVVTDMRFPNEMEALMRLSGGTAKTIRIFNPRVAQNELSNHASETHIDSLPVQFQLVNDGTVEELHRNIMEISKL